MKSFLYPKRLHIELTSCCNYRCIICSHGYENYGKHMNDTVYSVVLNELLPHAEFVEFQGTGESLLFPRIESFFEAINRYNIKSTLITNASLLNERNFLMLGKSGCHIVVSLDSPVKQTYEKIRRGGNFEKVYHNLSYWKFIKNNLLQSKNKPCLGINMVINKENYKELPLMVELCRELDVDYLFVSEIRPCTLPVAVWNELNINNLKAKKEFQEIIEKTKQLAKEEKLSIKFNFLESIHLSYKRNICISPWEHLFIFVNGGVSICCELCETFGNLNQSSFTDIWNGMALNEFRMNMAVGRYHNKCKNCCLQWGITH